MKKPIFAFLFLFTAWLPATASQHWPSPTGHLNDFAHVVPPDQAENLETLLTQLETKTGVQMAVVTMKSVEGGDIDQAAVDLFKAWGIGQKGKDNGLLILLSIGDRKDKIEVGYGLEGIITDGDTGTIRRHAMEPLFKQKEFGQGLTVGVLELAKLIEAGGEQNTDPSRGSLYGSSFWSTIFVFVFFTVLFYFLNRGGRRGHRGGWGGGFYGGGWSGGGWGGGGGGFGGFGGGGSGGGGSSGSW